MFLHEWIQSILYWLIWTAAILFVVGCWAGLVNIFYLIFGQIIFGPPARLKSKLSAATSHPAWKFQTWLSDFLTLAWLLALGLGILRLIHSTIFINK